MEFRHSSPEALHTKRRERPLLAKDVTKAKEFSWQSVIHEITRFFYMLQKLDMKHIFYFPPKEGMLGDFCHWPMEPANSGSIGQHANH
jgi:hypothetical protein